MLRTFFKLPFWNIEIKKVLNQVASHLSTNKIIWDRCSVLYACADTSVTQLLQTRCKSALAFRASLVSPPQPVRLNLSDPVPAVPRDPRSKLPVMGIMLTAEGVLGGGGGGGSEQVVVN